MADENTNLLQDGRNPDRTEVLAVAPPTPLPWRPFSILLLITAIQPLAFEIIFPFVNQMIVDIGVVTDPERVGFYSGLIESIFSLMSFLAIMPSTYLADRIGRKPVVLGGTTGLAVSVASFGMSKSFSVMVITRCLGGFLGGTWACTRIMIGEQTDRTNQNLAFQWQTMAHRLGQVIGLPLGGVLAHPARHFPLFRSWFWYEYPFALPGFVAAGITLCCVAGALTLVMIKTLSSRKRPARRLSYGATSVPDEDSVRSSDGLATSQPPPQETSSPSLRSILTPPVISILINNTIMCLASEALFAVFPLFCFTPIASGGLGLSEAAIGIQLGIRAALHIGIMGFYTPLERRFGSTVRFYRAIMFSWPLAVICMPLFNLLARWGDTSTWVFNCALAAFFTIWAVAGYSWVCNVIMVTNAAPSAAALASINGLSQMTMVLPQAIAPVLATSLFAFSIKSGLIGGNLIWVLFFALTFGAALHALTLREPTSDWREDRRTS